MLTANRGKVFFPSAQCSWGLIWSPGSSSGLLRAGETWRDWTKSNEGPPRWRRDWSVTAVRKGWESWDCSAWRREGAGDLFNVYNHLYRGCKEDRARLFSAVPSDRTRGKWAQTETQETPVWTSGNAFSLWGWPSTGTGCFREVMESLSSEVLKKSSRHSPGQLALCIHAWAGRLNNMTSSGPFLPQPFCDSVK